jgi:hypothetical protein
VLQAATGLAEQVAEQAGDLAEKVGVDPKLVEQGKAAAIAKAQDLADKAGEGIRQGTAEAEARINQEVNAALAGAQAEDSTNEGVQTNNSGSAAPVDEKPSKKNFYRRFINWSSGKSTETEEPKLESSQADVTNTTSDEVVHDHLVLDSCDYPDSDLIDSSNEPCEYVSHDPAVSASRANVISDSELERGLKEFENVMDEADVLFNLSPEQSKKEQFTI